LNLVTSKQLKILPKNFSNFSTNAGLALIILSMKDPHRVEVNSHLSKLWAKTA